MKARPETDLSGIWAVTWRAFVFESIGVAIFALLVSPVAYGVVQFYCGLWWRAAAGIGSGLLIASSWRHLRLRRLFETPPSQR